MLQGGYQYDEDGRNTWRYWFGSKRYQKVSRTFRHMRTTQERRMNDTDFDGWTVKFRRRFLPNHWDHEVIRDYGKCRTWKHNRKTRWK